ncbi:hypothetical protein SORBI_3003G136000 [Sorghum bicolor]|uniref:RanBP2-type domain-containing protein n=1 Tax=Sorghum bicolor TaxID=4558 RepID=A0A1W0VX80_SORBI|nr:hypothetical protein SORBI_3003G136000 [Sorghum bicolor]
MGSGMSRGRRRSFGAGASGGMLPLLALQVLIEYGRAGASRPPVTAALLAANALIYLRPGALDGILPSLTRVSFNPWLIIEYGDLVRFFLSPFYHLSESHLFYNMTSLLWKGIQLETSMGSVEFASMVAALLGLSQGITLLLSKGLLLLGDYTAYYNQYAVGFSGVLFAMKVVLNAWSEDFVYLHGMVIPAKYAAWAELILIQGRFTGRGRVGRRQSARDAPRRLWRCSTCTYDNSASTDICEMCNTAREDNAFSQRQDHQAGGNGELSVNEIRRRRLQRFDR